MIIKDMDTEKETRVALVEYLASFWNSEAVKRIREARESTDEHAFASDKQFEEMLKSESFRDKTIVGNARKNTNLKSDTRKEGSSSGRVRLPRDLTVIKDFIDKD